MSFQAVAVALKASGITPAEKLVLICIANYADENNQAWPSQGRLAEETGMARPSINRILSRLEAAGAITREQRFRDNGSQTACVITITPLSPKVTPPVTEGDTPCHLRLHPPVTEGDTLNLSDKTYQIKDDDVRARVPIDEIGWPSDWRHWTTVLCADIGLGDRPTAHQWISDRRSIDEYRRWKAAALPWQTVTEVVTDMLAKKRDGPPTTAGYFTKSIAQAHANQQAGIVIPQPRQANERSYTTSAERNQGSTEAAFRRAFADLADGEDGNLQRPRRAGAG